MESRRGVFMKSEDRVKRGGGNYTVMVISLE